MNLGRAGGGGGIPACEAKPRPRGMDSRHPSTQVWVGGLCFPLGNSHQGRNDGKQESQGHRPAQAGAENAPGSQARLSQKQSSETRVRHNVTHQAHTDIRMLERGNCLSLPSVTTAPIRPALMAGQMPLSGPRGL